MKYVYLKKVNSMRYEIHNESGITLSYLEPCFKKQEAIEWAKAWVTSFFSVALKVENDETN
jgi:hypothetical protein